MGPWSAQGMAPARVDHAEMRRRLDGQVEGWIVDELLDRFSPAWAKARRVAEETRRRAEREAARRGPRPRMGAAPADDEGGDA